MQQKINFITHFFLKILQRNSKLVILGNLGVPGHIHLKWYYQFKETFDVYLQVENQLHLSEFPGVIFLLQRYCKLVLDTLDMPGYTHPKCYCQFIENCHVYLQQTNQLYPPFFSEDWLSAVRTRTRTQEPEFCQIWDWWWNINNNISFHFRLFPRKTF